MKDRQIYLNHCLMCIGIDPTHKGYYQLLDCILIQAERHYRNIHYVYSDVAIKYGIKFKSVMRNISYALSKVEDLARKLSALLGFTVDDSILHNGSIINYLANLVSFPELFSFSA